MKYALAMGLLAIALAAGAVSYPAAAPLWIWAAISFGTVAAGYAGLGSRVFGKRKDGSMAWWAKLLLLPYLLFTAAIWHLCRMLSGEPAFNRISDDLVIGRRLLNREVPESFDHYIDLTSEFEEPSPIRKSPAYRSLPILDAGIPRPDDLRSLVEACASGRVYVHCAQGHGRTGLFTIALLFRRGRISTVDEGLTLLKQHRPAIALNRRQRRFLEPFQQDHARP